MRERELRRWGNVWVAVGIFVLAVQFVAVFTGRPTWVYPIVIVGTGIMANLLWLRADIARGRP